MDNSQTTTDGDLNPNFSSDHQKRSDPEPSGVSVKTDWSMDPPIKFKSENACPDQRSVLTPGPVTTKPVCRKFEQPENRPQNMDPGFSHKSNLTEVLNTFRSNLREKCQCLYEGTSQQGNPTLLNEIYTELYITESESGDISYEHEVRQIETHSRRAATEDKPIKCNDIFKPSSAQDKPIRTVLTKGVAGIGKTVSVQKFILDWAEGNENQDVHLIFPLPFREINLMKTQKLSLLDLLHVFFPETKVEISSDKYKVLFIFDGLDECRLSLDFHNSVRLCDVRESASVDVLLTNLIKGNLLPSALIWITSRPAAADQIPSECVDRVTEVRGFSDPQKEEYFRKRISDESMNNRIISHLKSSRSLYIMCHIPVFCWISATVLERMLSEAASGEIPKTLTQMYTHFLIIQTNIKHLKDYEKKVMDEDMIFKLGKLAFEQLVKGNLIFYEEDLRECGIDVAEASVYSGLCTQIFREEFGWYQGKVYCFVHLSIQEHLAALYCHLSFTNNNINVFNKTTKPTQREILISDLHQRAVDEALHSKSGHLDLFLRFFLGLAVESNHTLLQNLMSHTGSCTQDNTETAEYIKKKINSNASSERSINLFHCLNELGDDSLVAEVQQYLFMNGPFIYSVLSSSQWSAINFVLLTSEPKMDVFRLNKFIRHHFSPTLLDVVSEERKIKNSEKVLEKLLAIVNHSRAAEVLMNVMDTPELNEYYGKTGDTDYALVKLLPTIKAYRSADLRLCDIKDTGCAGLASVLTSNSTQLTELNLSKNSLGDSGLKLLSAGLQNSHCKLEKLKLLRCDIRAEGCAALASALRSNPSHLTELDLSQNNLKDSGLELLCSVLENPRCKLKILKLSWCNITAEGCAILASALRSDHSQLTELNLSDNKLGDSGVKLLSAGLQNPHCKLKILKLNCCKITAEGCAALASALGSDLSQLTELELSKNKLGDPGVKLLSAGLQNLHCKLKKLRLSGCNITAEGCAILASALRSDPSHLTELNLSQNNLKDSGLELLCSVLENPRCKLKILKLSWCNITAEGCAVLASALRSDHSQLTELNLSDNKLGDSGVKQLSAGLENPQCKLKILKLNCCKITAEGCAALASALGSDHSQLTELELSDNKLGDPGVKLLSAGLQNLHCKLKKLRLSGCNITAEGCDALASALESNPSHLTELNLSKEELGDSAVKLLSVLKDDPDYEKEIFWPLAF